MTYYLYADSHRAEGKRYTRGAELPDELGADLFERGYAVDDAAQLAHRVRLPLNKELRKALADAAGSPPAEVSGEAVVEEVSGEGVTAVGSVSQSALAPAASATTPANDSTAGTATSQNEAAKKPTAAKPAAAKPASK